MKEVIGRCGVAGGGAWCVVWWCMRVRQRRRFPDPPLFLDDDGQT